MIYQCFVPPGQLSAFSLTAMAETPASEQRSRNEEEVAVVGECLSTGRNKWSHRNYGPFAGDLRDKAAFLQAVLERVRA